MSELIKKYQDKKNNYMDIFFKKVLKKYSKLLQKIF